ncbi:hypothetical protein KY495_14465 [Massilia sp. PAMC28688]|uniref:hypothetical protein n=1 Tax=Massilia sp. PAMC28688 TaxID=2861283 RepID=UPI001C627963|nr:hypothetical protein [Massilia sp. PAMC28688]QYF91979.1 hypothetical protein KY495_14465 [Massilia sp. PAMC28688]
MRSSHKAFRREISMNDVSISGPGRVEIGQHCSIGRNVRVIFSGPDSVLALGDCVTLGDNVKLIVAAGSVRIGDWSALHENTLVLCTGGVDIAQHCWFGQNTILDGTGGLRIDDGVRVGMYSQIWSHVGAGELIEGCTLLAERPVHIESDVWLVGSCIVSPGVVVRRRTVALIGSNLTKDTAASSVMAGAPAKPKEQMAFYTPLTLEAKFAMLTVWLAEFAANSGYVLLSATDELTVHGEGEWVRFVRTAEQFAQAAAGARSPGGTLCCVENKLYLKCLGMLERRLLKFLGGNKARFYTAPRL